MYKGILVQFLSVLLILVPFSKLCAEPTPVTLERAEALIPAATNFPLTAWYKDIVLTPTSPGGPLMLYLPVTNTDDDFHEKIFVWDVTEGRFVDRSSTWWSLDPELPRDTYDADFVDLDGDGDADIVHSSPDGSRLLMNLGNEFDDQTATRMPAIMREEKVNIWDDVVAGDVDADGDLDLLFANRSLGSHGTHTRTWGPNILLYNDGEGFFNKAGLNFELFGTPSDEPSVLEGSSHGIKLADLDNDGRLDLLIAHNEDYLHADPAVSTPMVEVYRNLGDTNGNGKINWASWPSITSGNRPVNIAVFDFDHDGNLDFFSAGSSTDQIWLGSGDGTFSSSILAPKTMSSYDVAVGDLNADGFLDIATPAGNDNSNRAVYLNDSGSALVLSNEDIVNSTPQFHLSAAFADVDLDGDIDLVWGADNRGDEAPTRPIVLRNTSQVSDNVPPRIENPTMFLTTNDAASAMFRVRIEDRLLDLNEIGASFNWIAEHSDNSSSQGVAFLSWGANLTYQAQIPCTLLRANAGSSETITRITGTVSASDASGNQATLPVTAADGLASGLDGAGLAFGLEIVEPTSDRQSPVQPMDGSGRMLVRVRFTPSNFVPDPNAFEVRINNALATVVTAERAAEQVGSTFWLAVVPPAGLDGIGDIEVRYQLCNAFAQDSHQNAVVFGNPETSDTVLVMDTSGSMEDDRKMESAVGAASVYINTMRDQEHIGVVHFGGQQENGLGFADGVFPIEPVDGNRDDAIIAVKDLSPKGATSLGMGLLRGLSELNEVPSQDQNDVRALVLISDGMENRPHFWAASPDGYVRNPFFTPLLLPVSGTFDADDNQNIKIHTISLGPKADHQLMEDISFGRGEHRIEDLDDAPQNAFFFDSLAPGQIVLAADSASRLNTLSLPHRLANQYEHFHNAVSHQQRLWQGIHISQNFTPVASLGFLAQHRLPHEELFLGRSRLSHGSGQIPFTKEARPLLVSSSPLFVQQQLSGDRVFIPMEPGLSYATVTINWEAPASFTVTLTPPGPEQPAGTIESSQSATNKVFRIEQPIAGDWALDFSGPSLEELMITVSGISDERGFLRAVVGERRILADLGTEIPAAGQPAPGAEVPIVLALFGQQPVTGASVEGVATSVAGQQQTFALQDNGAGIDVTANDGIYTGLLTETSLGGAFAIEARASWIGADAVRRERIFPLTVTFAELDSDGDTISDDDEGGAGLDPDDPSDAGEDPDGDGWVNWKELQFDLDPHNPDTDGGGTGDGVEMCVGTDPLEPSDDDDARRDTDSDGLPDRWELSFGLNPNDPSDANDDLDNDGLTNRQELQYCTSPRDRDTDRDDIGDGEEVDQGTDPTDPKNRAKPRKPKEPIPERMRYSYAVKFLCGPSSESLQEGVVKGVYATAINISNPHHTKAVGFVKKFSRAYPYQMPGPMSQFVKGILGPHESIEVECNEIRKRLPSPMTKEFREGFVFIQSQEKLNVTAVYTSRASSGEVSSLDIQVVEPTEVEKPIKPQGAIPIRKPPRTVEKQAGELDRAPIQQTDKHKY